MSPLAELLGQIDANRDVLAARRPLDSASVLHALDVEYTYESNRIEGNTLTLQETALVIDQGLTIGGKALREHLEALNHYEATLFLRDWVTQGKALTESVVRQLHGLVLRGIDRDNAGRYRSVPVLISGSRHVPPEPWKVPKAMEDCFLWWDENQSHLHPVVLAAEMHERIVSVHPFIDGNGRTSRLVMNLVLLQRGYTIANIAGDGTTRAAYYHALERCHTEGDKSEFLLFIARQVQAFQERLLALPGTGVQP